jgi:eukaryotic-like serine/threonine-protein kinase
MPNKKIKDMLFGRLASVGRFVTEEQIAECVELQDKYREKDAEVPRLGELLSMKGYMTAEQVRAVLDGQYGRREGLFGEIAIRWCFLKREALDGALKFQRDMDAAGKHRARIGEILVGRGEIQEHHVRAILDAQGKKIIHCSGCSARFNLAHFQPGAKVKCPRCGATTQIGDVERHVKDDSPLDVHSTIWLPKSPASGEETGMATKTSVEIGGYDVLTRLGTDGTGILCRARHRATGQLVALKVMRPGPQVGQGFLDRFVEDTRHAIMLDHPGIKRVYEVGNDNGRYFLAEEFIDGRSIKRQLDVAGKISAYEACDISLQVSQALKYGQEKGIVHGDVRPSNVIIDDSGRARLAGLGVTKDVGLNLRFLGRSDKNIPFYVAPELAIDPSTADSRSDIYSLGAMLYHMVTGRPPFAGQGSLEVLMRLAHEPVIPPRQIAPDISPKLESLILSMMAEEPDDRFQDIDGVIDGLREVMASTEGATVPGPVAAAIDSGASALASGGSQTSVSPADKTSHTMRPVRNTPAATSVAATAMRTGARSAQRRYARERFVHRHSSSGGNGALGLIGLVAGGVLILLLTWFAVDQFNNPGDGSRSTTPSRNSHSGRGSGSRQENIRIGTPPSMASLLFGKAKRYANNHSGDDDEIAKLYKEVGDKYPASEYAKKALEQYRQHIHKAATTALKTISLRWEATERQRGNFTGTISDVASWKDKYPAAGTKLLAESRKLRDAVLVAKTDFIANGSKQVTDLIEVGKFDEAKVKLNTLKSLVNEQGAQLIADLMTRIEKGEKQKQLEVQAAKDAEAMKLAEEAKKIAAEKAAKRLAARFEAVCKGAASLAAKKRFSQALTILSNSREDFTGSPHQKQLAHLEESMQVYTAFIKAFDAGLKDEKIDARLPFGGKNRKVVGSEADQVTLDLGTAGKMSIPWRSFEKEDVAALALNYVDKKDGSSLLGYALFCSVNGLAKQADDYVARAKKLGAKVDGVAEVVTGAWLKP